MSLLPRLPAGVVAYELVENSPMIRPRIKEQHTVFARSRNSSPSLSSAKLCGSNDPARRYFELSRTVGTTDMPGRRVWSWFCPGSNTILTGTRWTTLT